MTHRKDAFERRLRFTDRECEFIRTLLLWGTKWGDDEFGSLAESLYWRFATGPENFTTRRERPVEARCSNVVWRA